MHGEGYMYWVLIGLAYWTFNLVIRKLHRKNESDAGWILTPFWIFGWPICFLTWLVILVGFLTKKIKNIPNGLINKI